MKNNLKNLKLDLKKIKKQENPNLPLAGNKIINSICEISINNEIKGFGFLVSLPINIDNRYLYGLLTLNEILSKQDLKVNNIINLNFKGIKLSYNYTISENAFVFSCPFMNVSFLEIPLNTIKIANYLRVYEIPYIDQKLCICQYNKNGTFNFYEGHILGFFGNYSLCKISNEFINNTNGSPIISLDECSFGDLIAINMNFFSNKKCTTHVSLNINIIIRAIRSLVHQNKITRKETLSEPKNLSPTEIHVLKKDGLEETENPYVFISPSSMGVTPLWFYRTHYAWFWTPTQPKYSSLDDLKKVNWSLIQANFPIKAIGGIWNNAEPAERNVRLIQYLINSGLRFLMPQS